MAARRLNLSGWQQASIAFVFLVSAVTVSVLSDGYLTNFFRIAQCPAHPPRADVALIKCVDVSSEYYYAGAIYLNVNSELVESLRSADVVILGNSRTSRAFATSAVERYFAGKGLRYFVLSSDGSGFRYALLMLEKLKVRPRIFLLHNETFFADMLEDFNRDVILHPDRFRQEMSAFYYSIRLQRWICGSSLDALKSLYCKGNNTATWRRTDNGSLYFDPDNYPDPPGHIPVRLPAEGYLMDYFERYMRNAREFLGSPSVQGGCLIDYLIPHNAASVGLARRMAAAIGVPFVFPEVDNLVSFDGSHLKPESSERWSAAFAKLADPHIDACLRKTLAKDARPGS